MALGDLLQARDEGQVARELWLLEALVVLAPVVVGQRRDRSAVIAPLSSPEAIGE